MVKKIKMSKDLLVFILNDIRPETWVYWKLHAPKIYKKLNAIRREYNGV